MRVINGVAWSDPIVWSPVPKLFQKLRQFCLNGLGDQPSGPVAKQLRQLVLDLLWPSRFDNRIFTHGVSLHCWFPVWQLDSSRIRQLLSYVRTPLSSIRDLEDIKLRDLRPIGLRLQGAPRGTYSLYVTLGATPKTEP